MRSRIQWHALLRWDYRCLHQRLRGQHLHMSEWHADRCHGRDRRDLVRHCERGGLQRVQFRIPTERSRRCWIPNMLIVPQSHKWDVQSVFVELDVHNRHLHPWLLRHKLSDEHQRLQP